MPSTVSALTTLLFGLSLLAPVVLVLAGIVFALSRRRGRRTGSVSGCGDNPIQELGSRSDGSV